MRTIFAEYNPQRNSIDVYTSAGYMLRIDCWEAEKKLMWVDAEESLELWLYENVVMISVAIDMKCFVSIFVWAYTSMTQILIKCIS